jgi:hypothetical protein
LAPIIVPFAANLAISLAVINGEIFWSMRVATHAMREKWWDATIFSLLFGRGPAAIFRFIVSIVVNSFKGERFVWFPSHVSKEVAKTGAPSFANSDPSASISRPVPIIRVFASGFHGGPRNIFRAPTRDGFTMGESHSRKALTVNASTTNGASTLQVATIDYLLLSAVANTKPSRSTECIGIFPRYNFEFSKPLINKINPVHSHILSVRGMNV